MGSWNLLNGNEIISGGIHLRSIQNSRRFLLGSIRGDHLFSDLIIGVKTIPNLFRTSWREAASHKPPAFNMRNLN